MPYHAVVVPDTYIYVYVSRENRRVNLSSGAFGCQFFEVAGGGAP
jgi:hypothetical protein